ncbi:MAG: hypothetical protein H0X41_08525 [Chitinophagaceae bacterium]|nr:hypothetical protein [Chitinophagaceae bacterium]
MTSGKAEINGNTITLKPGTQHNETTFTPDGDSVTVVSPSETKGYSVKDNGYYLLNLKTDTIAGAYQPVGTNNATIIITQDNLRTRMDSLSQLMRGTNVSEKARNYNIPPFTIAKITSNTDAQIIGPFVKIPGSFDPSQKHEVYKFYTNKEIMEILQKNAKMIDQ